MSILTGFWEAIDAQLLELRMAKTADDVIRILPAQPGMSSGDGFFGGGGGDDIIDGPLIQAGWKHITYEAPYHFSMRAPNGDEITYVEGDIYRGNRFA